MSILLEKSIDFLFLIIPPAFLMANGRLFKVKYSTLSIAIVSFIVIYCLLQLNVHLVETRLNAELDQFDLNKDGWFGNEEITPAQEKAMENVSSDTARTFAPYTGIIFSGFYVLLVVGVFSAIRNIRQRLLKFRTNRL
jgi:hypothetical protein